MILEVILDDIEERMKFFAGSEKCAKEKKKGRK
jgi:hypothetical protein